MPWFLFCWLKSYNYIYCREKSILFSDTFHSIQLPWVQWIFCLKLLTSRLGQFLRHVAAVSSLVSFCWVKSYNSAVMLLKSILFSANFDSTQLPWVPWIFWLKLLTSHIGQFSWHLAAVSFVFFCWLKSCNCAVLTWKGTLFSDTFQHIELPWVLWILCLKYLTGRLGQFLRQLAAGSFLFFFLLTKVL